MSYRLLSILNVFLNVFGFILLSLLSYPASPANATSYNLVLIANHTISYDQLSKKDIKNIFLGKQKFWTRDKKIIFATLKNNTIHEQFVRRFLHKTVAQYGNYWKKLVFTGRGIYPATFLSEKKLIDFIAKTPGAIGYISKTTIPKDVKVIQIAESINEN